MMLTPVSIIRISFSLEIVLYFVSANMRIMLRSDKVKSMAEKNKKTNSGK